MIDQAVLEEAIKRFPWRLARMRDGELDAIAGVLDAIIAEYNRILKDREKAKQYE